MRMDLKLVALVVAPIACFSLTPFSPANTGAAGTGPAETGGSVSVRMIGEKVCQLTGGYPIAIDALFYLVTGDAKYLANAARTAEAALDYWSGDPLWQDAPAFNSIFFRDLLALDLIAPSPAYRKALDRIFGRGLEPRPQPEDGLFDQGGIGHYGPTAGNYLDQASLVELFALKEWPRQALERVTFMGSTGPLPPQR